MKTKIILVIIMAVQTLSCIREASSEKVIFQIVNATEHNVQILFYTGGDNSSDDFAYSVEVDGAGLLIEVIMELEPLDSSLPSAIFGANFAELVFDNVRIEEHGNAFPLGRSIFGLTFESIKGISTYTITEENYNNAVPCDGPCK